MTIRTGRKLKEWSEINWVLTLRNRTWNWKSQRFTCESWTWDLFFWFFRSRRLLSVPQLKVGCLASRFLVHVCLTQFVETSPYSFWSIQFVFYFLKLGFNMLYFLKKSISFHELVYPITLSLTFRESWPIFKVQSCSLFAKYLSFSRHPSARFCIEDLLLSPPCFYFVPMSSYLVFLSESLQVVMFGVNVVYTFAVVASRAFHVCLTQFVETIPYSFWSIQFVFTYFKVGFQHVVFLWKNTGFHELVYPITLSHTHALSILHRFLWCSLDVQRELADLQSCSLFPKYLSFSRRPSARCFYFAPMSSKRVFSMSPFK